MKRFSLISVASIILIFIAVLTTPPLAWPQDIEVHPMSNDFGNVELDSSSTTIITISNVGNLYLIISDIYFLPGSSPDFSITMFPDPPGPIPPLDGGTVNSADVEITFCPSVEGGSSATLEISSNDPNNPLETVALQGVGVMTEPPPPVSIADILAFIDASVADGSLVGTGPGKSAVRRLNALRNQIEAAGDLIEDGLIEEACQQLLDAYRKCDGLGPLESPPDFVADWGASAELARKIQNLRISLGCG